MSEKESEFCLVYQFFSVKYFSVKANYSPTDSFCQIFTC